MQVPSTAELLDAWERAAAETPPERALTLLATASRGVTRAELAARSIGVRESELLAFRERLFGPEMAAAASCPACGDTLDLAFATSEVRADGSDTTSEASLVIDDWEISYRLPTSDDLIALTGAPDVDAVRRGLIARCVVDVCRGGEAASPEDLPVGAIEALADRMDARDPQACVGIALACPSCGHEWTALFDVGSYLWSEVDAWARRTAYEVHALASAYGWSEGDILTMGVRRRLYLDLVDA